MLIRGGRVATSAMHAPKQDLWITNGQVHFSSRDGADRDILTLDGHMILPGLINSHDHLELNLFPRLGNGPYANAVEWARAVYHPFDSPVREQLAIPRPLRLQWGGIKNLLSGVTTVAHHNPTHPILFDERFPIRVLRRFGWAHSTAFAPDWKERCEATPPSFPFLIHAGEGTDGCSRREIELLYRSSVLSSSTVLIHAVAVRSQEIDWLTAAGSSIVWCPSSNHFTLGSSLRSEVFAAEIPVALGSDSALTAAGDLLDELHYAARNISAERLYRMVTSDAASILKLPPGFGDIREGGPADLLIVEDCGRPPAETLLRTQPKLVIVGGSIRLVAESALDFLPPASRFPDRLHLEGRGSYAIQYPLRSLAGSTRQNSLAELRVAGKQVTV